MGRSVSLTHVSCYCTRCVRRACQDALRFTFCLLLQMACPPHQQWKYLFFKFIFEIWYIITSPLIGRAQLLLIVTKKKNPKKPHPTSLCGFPLLIDSLRVTPTVQPRVRKLVRALNWKGIAHETLFRVPFYFKVWDSCGVLADCLLWKSLGYNRKTSYSMTSLLYSARFSAKQNCDCSPIFPHLKVAEQFLVFPILLSWPQRTPDTGIFFMFEYDTGADSRSWPFSVLLFS